MTGFFKNRKARKRLEKLHSELVQVRHSEDDLLSDRQKSELDELSAETAAALKERRYDVLPHAEETYGRMRLFPRGRKMRDLLDLLLVVGAVAFGIRALFLQPFRIPTSSMQPTLYGIHFLEKEHATNPLLGKVPAPLNWLLFSARPARLEIREDGRLSSELRQESGAFSDSTRFRIGAAEYELPGDARKVAEYSNLEYDRLYRRGEVPVDGFLSLGDHLFVERWSIYLAPLKRGDVLVFTTDGLEANGRKLSDSSGFFYIKRLVGLPGDTLRIVDNHLEIRPEGATKFLPVEKLDPRFEKLYSGRGGYHGHLNNMGRILAVPGSEYTVPPDHYFMLGDNSEFSLDSRFFGPVPRRNLVGKAWLVFWPFSRRWGIADRQGPVDAPTGESRRGTFPVMYRQ